MELIKQTLNTTGKWLKDMLDKANINYLEINNLEVWEGNTFNGGSTYDLYIYNHSEYGRIIAATTGIGCGDDIDEEILYIKLEEKEAIDLREIKEIILDNETLSKDFRKALGYFPLNRIYTFAEATQLWGLADSTLRKVVATTNKLNEGIDYRKSGKVWLITEQAMKRLYGEPRQD